MNCHYCGLPENFPRDPAKGRQVELRPYGPGGAFVCFQCMTATPERERQAKRNFGIQLEAAEVAGGGVSVLDGGAPEPASDDVKEILRRIEEASG